MIKLVYKYYAIARFGLKSLLQYPLNMLSLIVTHLVIITVFVHLWELLLANNSTYNYSLNEILLYFLAAESLVLGRSQIISEINMRVTNGFIVFDAIRPCFLFSYYFYLNLVQVLLKQFILFLAGTFLLFFWGFFYFQPIFFLRFFCIALFVFVLDFGFNYLIAILSFKIEQTLPLQWIYGKLVLIFGGVLLPLDFFPDYLSGILKKLPFALIAYYPSRFVSYGEMPHVLNYVIWGGVLLCFSILFTLHVRKLMSVNGG